MIYNSLQKDGMPSFAIQVVNVIFFWGNDGDMTPINSSSTLWETPSHSETLYDLPEVISFGQFYVLGHDDVAHTLSKFVHNWAHRGLGNAKQVSQRAVTCPRCQPIQPNSYTRLHGDGSPKLSVLPKESWGEPLTDVIESWPWHPEVLNKLCLCKNIRVTEPPLLTSSSHPHRPLYPFCSHSTAKAKTANLALLFFILVLLRTCLFIFQLPLHKNFETKAKMPTFSMFTFVQQRAGSDVIVIVLLRMRVSSEPQTLHTGIWYRPHFRW